MNTLIMRVAAAALLLCARPLVPATVAAGGDMVAPATAADWQALTKLPDWSGVWTPVISDQMDPHVAQAR